MLHRAVYQLDGDYRVVPDDRHKTENGVFIVTIAKLFIA